MKPTLNEIEKLIKELAAQIQVPQYLLLSDKFTEGTHIEIDHGLLYYFHIERGQENFRYLAKDVDDLLYKVFASVTFSMALEYELKHRIRGQSFRRVMFQEQERLLGVLNEEWKLRRVQEVKQILIEHPFDDNVNERVTYHKQLVDSKQHEREEWLLACEKYPLLDKK
jgi:hypothetical protein